MAGFLFPDDWGKALERIAALEGDRNSEILRANNAEIRAEALEAENKRLREALAYTNGTLISGGGGLFWMDKLIEKNKAALAAKGE